MCHLHNGGYQINASKEVPLEFLFLSSFRAATRIVCRMSPSMSAAPRKTFDQAPPRGALDSDWGTLSLFASLAINAET